MTTGPGLPLLALVAVAGFAVRALPVARGAGLTGLLGYDDGVYFGTAVALVHGVVPYRDFVLVQPPGNVLWLTPFAALGSVLGDETAMAVARVFGMLLGSATAVLIAVVAGRRDRLAGVAAGLLYAVWNTAANTERSTDLHPIESFLVGIALLALAAPTGRLSTRRAAVAGMALGLATSVQLWQAATVAAVVGWIGLTVPGGQANRLRVAAVHGLAALGAFVLVCLPFLISAPPAMIRQALLDQIGRPPTGAGTIDRLRVLEGFAQAGQLPPALQALLPDWLVMSAAVVAAGAVLVIARRVEWSRLWAALAITQGGIVLVTPSFFNDYPSFMAQATTLVLGTGAALASRWAAARVARPTARFIPIGLASLALAVVSLLHPEGTSLPIRQLTTDLASARCVASDSASLMVLTSTLRFDLERRCHVVLDPAGVSYDAGRSRGLFPQQADTGRRASEVYQAAMREWYAGADAAVFIYGANNGLTAATWSAIDRALPIEIRRGSIVIRLAAPAQAPS